MHRLHYILLLLIVQSLLCAQNMDAQSTDRDYIRLGNHNYRKTEFDKSLTNYTKAFEKVPTVEAFYNLGNAALLQGQDSLALDSYQQADSLGFTNQLKRARNFHNMGNVWYMYGVRQLRSNGKDAGKAFQNAVNLFKSSLRCNPADNETRYNLAMAQHQLKKSQDKNGGGGEDNGQQNDKDKKDEQKKDEQKKEQQNKQDQQQQSQQQQDKKDQMSEQAVEQLLNSAQQDERNVQQKVKANPQRRRSLEKDW